MSCKLNIDNLQTSLILNITFAKIWKMRYITREYLREGSPELNNLVTNKV